MLKLILNIGTNGPQSNLSIFSYVHITTRLSFYSEFRRTGGKRFFALEKPSEVKVCVNRLCIINICDL